MLERYVEAGFDPEQFWGLSLRLYQIHMRGAAARLERGRDEAKAVAWVTALLGRTEKFPTLEKILRKEGEVVDVEFRLRAMRARLPKITLAEWQARQG